MVAAANHVAGAMSMHQMGPAHRGARGRTRMWRKRREEQRAKACGAGRQLLSGRFVVGPEGLEPPTKAL